MFSLLVSRNIGLDKKKWDLKNFSMMTPKPVLAFYIKGLFCSISDISWSRTFHDEINLFRVTRRKIIVLSANASQPQPKNHKGFIAHSIRF